ncbi:unnamed protein product [Linum tenue]|uniref:F-box domain-containing protein n=3 Tax=Linum tenue TaxID=586396 RepID=A0AAV0KLE5_9ROSI|nr:unnamed protein product [Linum tenue]
MPTTTQLIPGLPDDLSRDCLLRLKFPQFPSAASVCKSWNSEFHLPDFPRLRKLSSTAQNLFVFIQARVDPTQNHQTSGIAKYRPGPIFRLTVFEPATGLWSELLPPPSLPMFCQVASVGSDLVLLGGLDPETWEPSTLVLVFSFLTGTWRRGTRIPGPTRSFFGCAADPDRRTVFVAGGHDGEKNALRSCLAYDVSSDEWAPLPDMACERDECKAVFHRGRLHVIGGYRTEMQGRFERGAEVFDTGAAWRWGPVQDGFLETAACPRSCAVDDGDGVLYMCRRGEVVARRGDTWRLVAVLPDDVGNPEYVAAWGEGRKMLVVGSARYGEPRQVYMLDLKALAWEKLETPPAEYSGHVQGGCLVEI